jgi:hypothetical protein
MKKTIIHTVTVTKAGEKKQLQIKLPRNTKSVQAISVSANGIPRRFIGKRDLGWLWLRIPEQRDVFFAEVVKVPLEDYDRASYTELDTVSFGYGKAWIDGGKEGSFSILVEKCSTLLEGYYIDQLKGDMNPGYTVKIYLTIEV